MARINLVLAALVLVGAWATAASAACGTAQALVGGTCQSCSYGQVASQDGLSCIPCSGSTVKKPQGYNVVDAECVPANTVCGTAQTGVNGQCSSCTYGQVASQDGTSCITCAGSTVKSPQGYNVVDAQCVPAKTVCGTAQTGVNGQCSSCTYGQVATADGTSCVVCAGSTVKQPQGYNVVDAQCVAAKTACGTAQTGVNGQCSSCTYGQIASADGTSCLYCGAGLVKVPQGYNVVNAQCLPAVTACGSAQTGVNGQCASCTYGQVASADGTSCVVCAGSTVKYPQGYNVVDAQCVPAKTACGTAQTGVNGQCSSCTYGQVASADGTTCVVCAGSTVKYPQGYNVVDAQCVPALTGCGTAQTGVNGQCASCSYGQIRSDDGTSCVYCGAGLVKSPQGYNVANAQCLPAATACASGQTAVNGQCTGAAGLSSDTAPTSAPSQFTAGGAVIAGIVVVAVVIAGVVAYRNFVDQRKLRTAKTYQVQLELVKKCFLCWGRGLGLGCGLGFRAWGGAGVGACAAWGLEASRVGAREGAG